MKYPLCPNPECAKELRLGNIPAILDDCDTTSEDWLYYIATGTFPNLSAVCEDCGEDLLIDIIGVRWIENEHRLEYDLTATIYPTEGD
jgi:hypothetical protein